MTGSHQQLSTFELRCVVLDDKPDRPVVHVIVDGREAFVDDLPGWRGFEPGQMLGPESPFLPDRRAGRRVAVYRRSCGIEGCGVVAPVIVESPDGRTVSWVDFRDFVGVFGGPTVTDVDASEGRPWSFPGVHFARDQYVAEVLRASAGRSWETARRATARLVAAAAQHLLRLAGATGATGAAGEPAEAAAEIVDRLSTLPATEWLGTFGWEPRRRRQGATCEVGRGLARMSSAVLARVKGWWTGTSPCATAGSRTPASLSRSWSCRPSTGPRASRVTPAGEPAAPTAAADTRH